MSEPGPALKRELGLWDLVLFNISAVAGVRWVAAAAHAGPGSLSLWVLAALFFFLPSALVMSRLAERFPQEGGMYIWTKRAFGDWHGFLCAWFYFAGNVLYFPSLILAGVTMASYIFGEAAVHTAENAWFSVPLTLAVLWLALGAHLVGLRVGKWTANMGGLCTYAIAALLCGFGLWYGLAHGPETRFHIVPAANFDSLNFWSQIAFAFQGLELAPILAGEILFPKRLIPRAAAISGLACAAYYMASTAAVLALLTPEAVSPLAGLAQSGQAIARFSAQSWISPVFAILLSAGIFGQVATFMGGNTRLPFAIGLDRYLPEAFARLHPRWGTPYVSILTQGIFSTVLLVGMQLGETVRAAYQILVDMGVLLSFIPFVYIFASGIKLRARSLAAVSGLLVSILAALLAIVPPPEVASVFLFETKVLGGAVLFSLLGWLLFRRAGGARS